MASATNVDLVRSIYAAWTRGDRSSAEWAHPDIEFVIADGPAPGRWTGRAQAADAWRDFLNAWEELRPEAEGFRELDDERVLVLVRLSGRGRTSGLDLGQMRTEGADVHSFRDGKVIRAVIYFDRNGAFADLGLSQEGDAGEPPD